MQPRHPLPKRPNVGGSQPPPSQSSAQPQAWGAQANAAGASQGYGNAWGASGGYANASGGYPGYAGGAYAGYGYGNTSGGYPGYNASGGYPGYGGGGYYAAPVNPYAASPASASASASMQKRGDPARNRRTCSHAGCNFSGSPDVIATHEASHSNARAKATQKSEEEERWSKSGRVAYIQGTGIRLETPEEIAAWIAERKSKFPTAAKVAQRVSLDEGEY